MRFVGSRVKNAKVRKKALGSEKRETWVSEGRVNTWLQVESRLNPGLPSRSRAGSGTTVELAFGVKAGSTRWRLSGGRLLIEMEGWGIRGGRPLTDDERGKAKSRIISVVVCHHQGVRSIGDGVVAEGRSLVVGSVVVQVGDCDVSCRLGSCIWASTA